MERHNENQNSNLEGNADVTSQRNVRRRVSTPASPTTSESNYVENESTAMDSQIRLRVQPPPPRRRIGLVLVSRPSRRNLLRSILQRIRDEQTNNRATATGGLTEEVILRAMEPVGANSEDEKNDCPICLIDFEEGDSMGKLHQCDHCYHYGCIKNWLKRNNICPKCRKTALLV